MDYVEILKTQIEIIENQNNKIKDIDNKVDSLKNKNYTSISPELYTVMEVASKLKTTKQKVYELIKSGNLAALKLGNLKVTSYELDRFIRQCNNKDYTDPWKITEL